MSLKLKAKTLFKGLEYGKITVLGAVLRAVDADLGKRYVVKELSRLPGLSAKMGQLLALKFGKMEWQEFAPEPVALSWIKARIDADSPRLAQEIDLIDPTALLASLGQVHKVLLKSGQEVAVKVRYPQVDQEIEEQIELILLAFGNMPKLVSTTLNVASYETFLRDFFKKEVDYRVEAESQTKFREAWRDSPKVCIPEVFHSLSSNGILVQSFEESQGLKELWSKTPETRLECAKQLTDFFLRGLFEKGLVHTDMHPKNWGFRPESHQLVVYDFGAVLEIPLETRELFVRMVTSPLRDENECLEIFVNLGFDREKMSRVKMHLPDLISILLSPLRSHQDFNPVDWKVQEKIEALLGEGKWDFRSAGPPWFLMLMRAFNGWIYAMKELRVSFSPRSVWPVHLGKLLNEVTPEVELPTKKPTNLKVSVKENGKEIVGLEFPARTVESLENLIPEDVLVAIKNEGIKLSEISKRAVQSGYKAQVLFERKYGNRVMKVWLE